MLPTLLNQFYPFGSMIASPFSPCPCRRGSNAVAYLRQKWPIYMGGNSGHWVVGSSKASCSVKSKPCSHYTLSHLTLALRAVCCCSSLNPLAAGKWKLHRGLLFQVREVNPEARKKGTYFDFSLVSPVLATWGAKTGPRGEVFHYRSALIDSFFLGVGGGGIRPLNPG